VLNDILNGLKGHRMDRLGLQRFHELTAVAPYGLPRRADRVNQAVRRQKLAMRLGCVLPPLTAAWSEWRMRFGYGGAWHSSIYFKAAIVSRGVERLTDAAQT
jgi:hypothetical protein